jgi:hypothetical protein
MPLHSPKPKDQKVPNNLQGQSHYSQRQSTSALQSKISRGNLEGRSTEAFMTIKELLGDKEYSFMHGLDLFFRVFSKYAFTSMDLAKTRTI